VIVRISQEGRAAVHRLFTGSTPKKARRRSDRYALIEFIIDDIIETMPFTKKPPDKGGFVHCKRKPRDSRVVEKSLSDEQKNPNVLNC